MSRTLGEALIAIIPDTNKFGRMLKEQVKIAVGTVNGEVPITANTAKLDAAIASSKSKMADLQAQMKNSDLGANSKGLDKAIAKATAEVADLQNKTGNLKMDADAKALTAKITDMESKSKHLQDTLGNLKSDVDVRAALAKIQSFEAQIKVLKSEAADIALKASDESLKKSLDDAMVRLEVLKDQAQNVKLGANADKLNALIKLEEVKIEELTRKRDLNVKVKVDDAEAVAKLGFLQTLMHGSAETGAGKNGVGGVGGEILQTVLPGGGATTLPGVAGLGGIALGVLSTGFAGIVPLITAATGALGAFGILAIPTIKSVVTGLTKLSTATGTYGDASSALDAGIKSSPQNLKAYQKSLADLSPQLAGAAELLTNQGTTWANLTPRQRESEVALKNNAAAYKALLPAQKNALNALLQEGVAYNGMTPGQRAAAVGIQALEKEFGKLSLALAPITFKVLNAGLAVVNTLLPDLLPFAKVAGDALIKLLGSFEAFAKSPGFKAFLANMLKLAGPSILAIGYGLGKVIIAVGKLLVAMESPDALVILTGLFRVLADVIDGIALAFKYMTPVMVNAFRVMNDTAKIGIAAIVGIFKGIGDFLTGNWSALWHDILGTFKTFVHDIGDAIQSVRTLWDKLVPASVRTEIANIFDGVRHDTAHIWDLIYNDTIGDVIRISHDVETQFNSFRHAVANIFDGTRHDIATIWNDVYGATVGVAIRIGHDIESDFNNMKIEIARIWGDIGDFFAHWWGSTKNFIDSTVDSIGHNLTNAWDSIEDFVKRIWGDIGDFFAHWWGSTKNFIDDTVSNIGHDLINAWNSMKNDVGRIWGDIGDFFAHWWGSTKNFFSNTTGDIGNGLRTAWNDIKNDVSRLWGDIGDFFARWWGSTENFIGNAASKTIRNGLSAAWRNIGSDAKTLWADIGGFMSSGVHAGVKGLVSVINGVINFVLNPLVKGYNTINDIWSGADISPIRDIRGFRAGGKVTAGTGDTADDVVVRVSKNETILSAAHSRVLAKAGILGGLGVPGYAKGGMPAGIPADLGQGIGPSESQMVSWFGGIGDPSHETTVPFSDGHSVTINKLVAQSVRDIGAEIQRTDPGYVDSSTGGFRTTIGATTSNIPYSMHQLGLAIDVNYDQNPYLGNHGTILKHPGVINAFQQHGWFWGGNWGPGGRDQEHFQLENTRFLSLGGSGGSGVLTGAQIAAFNKYMALVNTDIKLYSPEAIARAFEKNPGPLPTGVLTNKGLAQYKGMGGNAALQIKPAITAKYNAAVAAAAAAAQPGGGGSGPSGVGANAGEMANGRQIYNYLLKNLFGGNKIAAAGATASIWGESLWDPFKVGSGGRGLIGWTPEGTISDADFNGGMRTQLPAILRFVVNSGDSGTIAEMFRASSVLQAANEWGHGVERFGINDVHSEGLVLAKQIAGLKAGGRIFDSGGTLAPGGNYVWNGTGHPEPLVPAAPGGGNSMTAGERAILAELRHITHATNNAPARFGQAINKNLSRGAGRGYYGG